MKHEFALSAKLAALDVGHEIYLNNPDGAAMANQVHIIASRSKKLSGRTFVTMEVDAITVYREHRRIVSVKRTV